MIVLYIMSNESDEEQRGKAAGIIAVGSCHFCDGCQWEYWTEVMWESGDPEARTEVSCGAVVQQRRLG